MERVNDDVVLMVELLVEVLVEVLLVFVDGVPVEEVEVGWCSRLVEVEDDVLYVVDVELLVVLPTDVLVDEQVAERLGDDVDVDEVSAENVRVEDVEVANKDVEEILVNEWEEWRGCGWLRWKSKTRWSTKLSWSWKRTRWLNGWLKWWRCRKRRSR